MQRILREKDKYKLNQEDQGSQSLQPSVNTHATRGRQLNAVRELLDRHACAVRSARWHAWEAEGLVHGMHEKRSAWTVE